MNFGPELERGEQDLMRVIQPGGEVIRLSVTQLAGKDFYRAELYGVVRMVTRSETFVSAVAQNL